MSKGLIGFILSVTINPLGIPSIILCWHFSDDDHPNLALTGFILGWVMLTGSVFLLAVLGSEGLLW